LEFASTEKRSAPQLQRVVAGHNATSLARLGLCGLRSQKRALDVGREQVRGDVGDLVVDTIVVDEDGGLRTEPDDRAEARELDTELGGGTGLLDGDLSVLLEDGQHLDTQLAVVDAGDRDRENVVDLLPDREVTDLDVVAQVDGVLPAVVALLDGLGEIADLDHLDLPGARVGGEQRGVGRGVADDGLAVDAEGLGEDREGLVDVVVVPRQDVALRVRGDQEQRARAVDRAGDRAVLGEDLLGQTTGEDLDLLLGREQQSTDDDVGLVLHRADLAEERPAFSVAAEDRVDDLRRNALASDVEVDRAGLFDVEDHRQPVILVGTSCHDRLLVVQIVVDVAENFALGAVDGDEGEGAEEETGAVEPNHWGLHDCPVWALFSDGTASDTVFSPEWRRTGGILS
jgi:hypothetical protein